MNTVTQIPRPKLAPAVASYDARELIKDGTQISIVLDDQTYFLRITKSGKLILTK